VADSFLDRPTRPIVERGPRGWTDEETLNAMTYGVCWLCRCPRRSYVRFWAAFGYGESEMGIECSNDDCGTRRGLERPISLLVDTEGERG